jgi:hypothetical protein
LKKSDVIKKGLFDAVVMAKKAYDIVLHVKRKKHKLSKRTIDLKMKMEHEVKKARDATTFFLSLFKHVLESEFSAGKSIVKKGRKNGLAKYWKSKGQMMGETRNVLIRRMSRKGGCFNMPSESFSTQL